MTLRSRDLAPDPERIRKVVCDFYGNAEQKLLHSRRRVFKEPRNVAIYLIRRLRGDSLKEMDQEFGISKYSLVSSVVERMKALIATGPGFKETFEKHRELSKSQEQT